MTLHLYIPLRRHRCSLALQTAGSTYVPSKTGGNAYVTKLQEARHPAQDKAPNSWVQVKTAVVPYE